MADEPPHSVTRRSVRPRCRRAVPITGITRRRDVTSGRRLFERPVGAPELRSRSVLVGGNQTSRGNHVPTSFSHCGRGGDVIVATGRSGGRRVERRDDLGHGIGDERRHDVGHGAETTSETAAVEILPPDESWAGVTRGEWSARWWQWASACQRTSTRASTRPANAADTDSPGRSSSCRGNWAGEACEHHRVWSPRAQRSM